VPVDDTASRFNGLEDVSAMEEEKVFIPDVLTPPRKRVDALPGLILIERVKFAPPSDFDKNIFATFASWPPLPK